VAVLLRSSLRNSFLINEAAMSDIMHIGISALMAYQAALNVASQNIANADTPYYSRREVSFRENPFNAGVDIAEVRRIFDESANRYVQQSASDLAKWDVYQQQIGNFETLLDDDSISVNKFLNDALGALQQIENNFNPSNRSLYLRKLTALTNQFKSVDNEITRQIQNVNFSLDSEVKQANNVIGSLASINKLISGAGTLDHPELLDQREALVQELAKYMNITPSVNQAGYLDVSLSNGLSILSRDPPVEFYTETEPNNPMNSIVTARCGENKLNIEGLITSGEISGWINYRKNGLESVQHALDRMALCFIDNLNTQNKLGIDSNSALGSNIFNDINTTSMTSNRMIPNSHNTGNIGMTITVNDVSQLTTSDYRLNIGNANAYILTRISDNVIVDTGTASLPHTVIVDGFTMSLNSGILNVGDQYIISPTLGAVNNMDLAISDASQLALGWPVNASSGIKQPDSNGTITVDSITDTTNASFSVPLQLMPPIEIRFSEASGVIQYSLYNSNDNTLIEGPINYVQGGEIFPTPAGYDPGYRIIISGNRLRPGDTFNVQYNVNSTGDNRNALASAALYQTGTVKAVNGNLVNFHQAYTLLANDLSGKTNEANARYESSVSVKEQAEARRDRLSGVSLEEETLNLSRFQTAYQASAQVLQIAKSILDIISSIRG
jgi:flagellar hook-associated protein 1 FlgK